LTRREAEHAKANVDAFGIYQCSDVSAIISL
jgi:hypothetical protein